MISTKLPRVNFLHLRSIAKAAFFYGFIGGVFFFVQSVASAQAVFTIREAMRLAADAHPQVISKRSERLAAGAELEAAEWRRYPTPALEITSNPTPGASSRVLLVDQPLWTGGRLTGEIKAAASRVESASAAVRETQQSIAQQVIVAYGEVLRQNEKLNHAKRSVQEHERLLDMIKRRVSQEVSARTDQRLAESRLLQAMTDAAVTQLGATNSRAKLKQLCGVDFGDVQWPGFVDTDTPNSLQKAVELALANSPTLGRLDFAQQAAKHEIDVTRAATFPQVTLRLQSTTGGYQPDSRIMLMLTAQPGAGLSVSSAVKAAVSRWEMSQNERDVARRAITENVTLLWNDLIAARQRIATANQTGDVSAEVFESYKRQYVIGRKSWIDVLNAVREMTQAQYAREDARAQVASSSLQLRALIGTLSF